MKVHGFLAGTPHGYLGRAFCGEVATCVTTRLGEFSCVRCLAMLFGLQMTKRWLREKRAAATTTPIEWDQPRPSS